MSIPFGPTQRANSAGSVWARMSCAGVASKSRVMRMIGRVGSASIETWWRLPVVVMTLLLVRGGVVGGHVFAAHLGEHVVEALVALLGLASVALDPLGHQVEHLGFEVTRPPLGVPALADEPGVGEHLDVLGHGLDGDVVGIGQLPDGGVARGEAGHHVAPRRVGEGSEDSGQPVVGHDTTSVRATALFNSTVENKSYAGEATLSTARLNMGRGGQRRWSARKPSVRAQAASAAGSWYMDGASQLLKA